MGNLKKHNKFAHKEIGNILKDNCFRNTSICPGDAQQFKDTYALDMDDPCKYAINEGSIFNGNENASMTTIGDNTYHRVYTDGSGLNGTSRALARAG